MKRIKSETFKKLMTEWGIDRCLSWYLIASYGYYIADNPIMTDEQYDKLGRRLMKERSGVNHPHKKLLRVTNNNISAFQIKKYPLIVQGAYHSLFKKLRERDQ
jgi:hypothetical protein